MTRLWPIACFAAALATALPMPAAAVLLRGDATLDRAEVRLSDLFADLGRQGDKVLGPGPAPGGRIVVESAQLAAIARQFGVDWRPSSGSERAVLDRPGRPLSQDELVAALRPALPTAGAPAAFDIELPGYDPPVVAAGVARLTVERLDYDPGTQRFSALLVLDTPGTPVSHLRVAGQVVELITVPVPQRRIVPGELIGAGDLRMMQLHAALVRSEIARQPADALGLTPRRTLAPGQPMVLADLGKPAVVTKGQAVLLRLEGPGLTMTATAQAMASAGLGERVRLRNTVSGAVLEALVSGPGEARLAPDSTPLLPGGRAVVAAQ
jgi:flagella basal body P-ring formation protein FlgA